MFSDVTLPSTTLPIANLAAIVNDLRPASAQAAATESWYDAAISGSFSVSNGTGSLQGWISFYDGTKVHFELVGNPKETEGSAAGLIAVPYFRVRPADTFAGKNGTFVVSGLWAGGALTLICDGRSITQEPIPVTSAAPWSYRMEGVVRYTKG